MEKEKNGVKICDFFLNSIDLGFFEGDSAENQVLFFKPLFEEEFVGWGFGDLVKWVLGFRLH